MQILTVKGVVEEYWRENFGRRSPADQIRIIADEIYREQVQPKLFNEH